MPYEKYENAIYCERLVHLCDESASTQYKKCMNGGNYIKT